jgi:hypothetical protein
MQQIAVKMVGAEPLQRLFASPDGVAARCICGEYFRYQEYLITPPLDRLRYQTLDGAITVHLGSVDMGEAPINTMLQRRHGGNR